MAPQPSIRRCSGCTTRLAQDNRSNLCSACTKKARNSRLEPPGVPAAFWQTPEMQEALASCEMGAVIRAFRTHPFHGRVIPQEVVAGWGGIAQPRLSQIEGGESITNIDKLTNWARVLGIPPDLLWFKVPDAVDQPGTVIDEQAVPAEQQNLPRPDTLFMPVNLDGRFALVPVDRHAWLACAPGTSPAEDDFTFSPADGAKVIEEFTALDMASRRAFLVGLALLAGTPLVAKIRRWAAMLPVASVSSGQIGVEQINDLEQAVTFFRRWDASGNGGLHRKAVVGQLNAVAETLRENHSPGARRRLFQVAAELAQLAGWMTYDAGAFELAQRYYLLALDACKHADALDLGAKIVGDMAQLSTAAGNYDDSLAMVRTALAILPRGANPLVRSELHGLEARAYAQLGSSEVSNARRSVDACVEVFEEAVVDAQPDWIHYMSRAEVECLAANTYTELALQEEQPRRALVHACYAEMHTHNAIQSRDTTYTRSRILDAIRLSKVRLAQREPVEAATVALAALRQADTVRSSVVVKWFVNLSKPLVARYGDVPMVDTFQSELRTYMKRASGRIG